MKTLFIVTPGDNRVPGTTVTAMSLTETLKGSGVEVRAYDLDGEQGPFHIIYKAAPVTIQGERETNKLGDIFDDLLNGTEPAAVVDSGHVPLWQLQRGLLTYADRSLIAEKELRIVVLWLLTASTRSITQLEEARDQWKEYDLPIEILPIANEDLQRCRAQFFDSSNLAASLKNDGFSLADMPLAEPTSLIHCFAQSLTLGKYANTKLPGHRLLTSRQIAAKNFLEEWNLALAKISQCVTPVVAQDSERAA